LPLAGIVLTSSVTSTSRGTALSVPMIDLSRIRVPVLVMHHKDDACTVCEPGQAHRIYDALVNAPVKKLLLVSGGDMFPTGNPCEALHHHGYIGMEKEAVGYVTGWIANPQP
jgi:pimeloyl-ACP methyl ester carboxylesterase